MIAVQAILSITLAATVVRTIGVIDAIHAIAGRASVLRQAATTAIHSVHRSQVSTVASPRSPRGQQAGMGSSKVRPLHLWLVAVHVTAILAQVATVLKYVLPVTVSNCTVTQRFKVAFTLLYNMMLVIFLLAKVKVTNGSRQLALWEKGVIWLSRLYAWIYSPYISVIVSATYPGGITEEGTHCYNGFDGDGLTETAENAIAYAISNGVLMIQFVLLLVLFVKPLLVRVEGTQSGGAAYRRVVQRNIICTATLVLAYLVTTVVTANALLQKSPDENTHAQIADTAPMINCLLTLCLTEIALPLGFSSCWKACSSVYRDHYPTTNGNQADGVKAMNGTRSSANGANTIDGTRSTTNAANTITTTNVKVVPVQHASQVP